MVTGAWKDQSVGLRVPQLTVRPINFSAAVVEGIGGGIGSEFHARPPLTMLVPPGCHTGGTALPHLGSGDDVWGRAAVLAGEWRPCHALDTRANWILRRSTDGRQLSVNRPFANSYSLH